MKPILVFLLLAAFAGHRSSVSGADPIFSGPQPGERTTPFKVVELTGANAGQERKPITDNAGSPTALVFLHAVERSLVPLLQIIDQYGIERKDRLKTEVVFLSADRLEGESRAKAALGSLRLQARAGLSVDGLEGPGNYGLNKQCMMTIIVTKENKVTASFALVQPGVADAPKVIEALAKACGDSAPPTAEQLQERKRGQAGMTRARAGEMQGNRAALNRERAQAVDFSKYDLDSETGLRDAVRALVTEVQSLRGELAALRGTNTPTVRSEATARPRELPGAAPTDAQLVSLLRRFIQPTNEDAAVDKALAEVEAYVKGNPDLTRQAIDGWIRVLAIPYGTAYAQAAGKTFVDKLKSGGK